MYVVCSKFLNIDSNMSRTCLPFEYVVKLLSKPSSWIVVSFRDYLLTY